MHTQRLIQGYVISLFISLFSFPVIADDSFSTVEIQARPACDGIYMLTGKGGNIGLSIGTDGVFLIDDQFTADGQGTDDDRSVVGQARQVPAQHPLASGPYRG